MELDFGGETSGQDSGVAKVAAQLVSTSISAGSLDTRGLRDGLVMAGWRNATSCGGGRNNGAQGSAEGQESQEKHRSVIYTLLPMNTCLTDAIIQGSGRTRVIFSNGVEGDGYAIMQVGAQRTSTNTHSLSPSLSRPLSILGERRSFSKSLSGEASKWQRIARKNLKLK